MNKLHLCGSFAGLKHKTAKPAITEEATNIQIDYKKLIPFLVF